MEAAGVELGSVDSQVANTKEVNSRGDVMDSQIDSHDLGSSCPELARVVWAWKRIPNKLRRTIADLVSALGGQYGLERGRIRF